MRRTLASLAVVAATVGALTGCMFAPPGAGFGWYGSYDDPDAVQYDPAQEDEWQEEARQQQLEATERIAAELRAVGSDVVPAEGESLEAFRHVVHGIGWEWCERLFVDQDRTGDPAEHERLAERYGWTAEDIGIVAAFAERELCGI